MAATLTATFTLISCVQGSLRTYNYKDIRILFGQLSVTLNCECEVKNPPDLYAVGLRKYGTTVRHVLCVILCICTYIKLRHGGVI